MATLINGDGNLAIAAAQDADWFASIMGNQTSITGVGHQFSYEIVSATEIALSDGVIITKEGRRIQLDTDQVDIFDIPAGGADITNYYIIGYYLYRDGDSNELCEPFVELMDSSTATIEEDTFKGGADEVFVSLYRVTFSEFAISNVQALLPSINSIRQIMENKQDKLTNPLTQADVKNNLTSTDTNKPLSAAQGKKLGSYPKILNCIGLIANASNDNFQGTGVATVTLYASGLAKIDYQYTVTTAGSTSATSNYLWGLNRNLLTTRNSNIPTITPVAGGVAEWYNGKSNSIWSALHETYNGYGCTNQATAQFWLPSRNYNGTSIGALAVSNAYLNMKICGTCYGTFTAT